jgi:hypothetical protein
MPPEDNKSILNILIYQFDNVIISSTAQNELILNKFYESIEITLKDVYQLNDNNTIPDIFIRAASAIILVSFFIAIRRKLERRFRH